MPRTDEIINPHIRELFPDFLVKVHRLIRFSVPLMEDVAVGHGDLERVLAELANAGCPVKRPLESIEKPVGLLMAWAFGC